MTTNYIPIRTQSKETYYQELREEFTTATQTTSTEDNELLQRTFSVLVFSPDLTLYYVVTRNGPYYQVDRSFTETQYQGDPLPLTVEESGEEIPNTDEWRTWYKHRYEYIAHQWWTDELVQRYVWDPVNEYLITGLNEPLPTVITRNPVTYARIAPPPVYEGQVLTIQPGQTWGCRASCAAPTWYRVTDTAAGTGPWLQLVNNQLVLLNKGYLQFKTEQLPPTLQQLQAAGAGGEAGNGSGHGSGNNESGSGHGSSGPSTEPWPSSPITVQLYGVYEYSIQEPIAHYIDAVLLHAEDTPYEQRLVPPGLNPTVSFEQPSGLLFTGNRTVEPGVL